MVTDNINKIEDPATYKSSTDYIGALSSSMCMVHCMITPVIFAVQAGSLSCSEISPLWWKTMDVLFLIVSLFAIIYTAKKTSLKYMPILLYSNWALLAIFVLNSLFHIIHMPHSLIYIPALALVVLHLYNRKYCVCEKESCCVS